MEEQKLLKKRNKALKDNNESVLIGVCTDLANLYMDEGRYDFAIAEYKTVANIYKKQKKQLEYAVVNRGIGEAYLGVQQFEKALHHQKIYLDISRELKNKLEEQRALATIGHTYLSSHLDGSEPEKNNLELANKFFKKSLVVSQSLNGQASKLEIADMSARLFSNLGVVQDCMGNFKQASELITKSINLCRAHDLYEQLQRGHTSLASLLVKKEDHRSALQQYNLAAEAAKKLRNKPVLLANVLLSKSEILVKLGDLQGAKTTLLKAYKLKIPDVKDHKTIETNLRVVASMCYNEDKLLMTDTTDYLTLKKLYEKMGDGACDLRQFDKALDYYKKMLDCATKAELSGSDLASCYYSLAETFKDNGQFQEAVGYFERELELCNCLKDRLNTLSKIADTKEAADSPVPEVQVVYDRAMKLCQEESNIHEEGRMLKRFILYLRRQKQHCEAFKLEQTLTKLDFHSSDSESENSESQTGSIMGAEIDLDAITDVSDDSDSDLPATSRRRPKTFQVKRNIKGETQLHTACIKGQLNVVSHLLEQGHPVNVRDNCGWLPLHEACINGHIDVVELLLDKGAAINDRGGTQCEGITPLHDAASNGHLPIAQLLLTRGANAVAKSDEGDTVLNFLRKWRSTVELTDENQQLYESIVEQISRVLDKAGHVVEKPDEVEVRVPNRDLRRSAIIGLEDEDSSSPPRGSGCEYKDVMETLRHRTTVQIPARKSLGKRSALLAANDIVDDWLEDDIGKSAKKRKTNSPVKPSSSSPAASHSSRWSNEAGVNLNDSLDDFQIFFDDEPVFITTEVPKMTQTAESQKTSPKKYVRKKQAKLTNFGHTRTFVEADSTSSPNRVKESPRNLPVSRSFDNMMEPTLSVDVRIDKRLYRVPILLSQVNTLTIKWLADQAAARYSRKEYMIPTLELETQNGAILADDDPINLLFPMGATQAEEVEARIVKTSVPPLIDRFRDACQDLAIVPHETICRVLEQFTVNLDLSNRGLKGASLSPLCKVLNRQNNLLELDLSGNFLTTECFQFLSASFTSLDSLYKLNLNCTGFRSEHLQILIKNLSSDATYKMTDLNLSDNLLGDQSFETLALLTRCFQLRKLNLSGNKFTRNIFHLSFNKELTLNLDHVEDFDISDNDLSSEVLKRIISWLNCSIVTSLNVSRTSVKDGFLKEVFNNWTEAVKLKICKFSRCHVNDSDLFDLIRMASSLKTLDVSYNNDLTSISLRRLLQSDIENIDMYGCNNVLQYFTDFSRYLDESSRDHNKGKTLKISLPVNCDIEKEYLKRMWTELYGEKTIVELGSRFLCLSLSK